MRPPDGSTAVTCNAVTLGLVLTKRHRKQARQRDRLYLDTYDQRTNGNALDTEDEYDLFDMYEPCTQYDANPPCPADCEEWLLDDNDDNRSNGGHIAVYQNEQTSEEDLLPWRPPLLKRRSSISVYDLFENQITAEYCARAVDAALRLAISGSRARLSKEFTVARANSIRPWQDTMPALWSPGYLPQLASRAAFMSTIADSLGSVVSCTAESSNTQHIDSATSSSKQSPTLATGVYQNSDSCRSSDADTVPCQLWSLLHSHFCQQQTTYHLRPLSVTAAHNANAPKSAESLDELLDPSQAELLEDSESLSSEDEDLYFDDDVQFLQDETSVNADETLDDLEDGCDHWSELEFVSQHDSCKSGGHGTALIVDSHDHFYQY